MADRTTSNGEAPSKDKFDKETVHGYIKEAVNKLGPEVSKEQKIEHAKLLVKIFEKGMSPREAMEISDAEIGEIYTMAYHKFSSGKYKEAKDMFRVIFSLDPLNSAFATAFGVCLHKTKDYDEAIVCYMLGWILEPENPVSLFYAYDCYVNLNNDVCAGIMLCNVVAICKDNPLYAHIKQDAQLRLDALQIKIIADNAGATSTTS